VWETSFAFAELSQEDVPSRIRFGNYVDDFTHHLPQRDPKFSSGGHQNLVRGSAGGSYIRLSVVLCGPRPGVGFAGNLSSCLGHKSQGLVLVVSRMRSKPLT
jgi:hypothetical protein